MLGRKAAVPLKREAELPKGSNFFCPKVLAAFAALTFGFFSLIGRCVMVEMNNGQKKERVVTFLNRDEVDFLDKLGKDALFSSGAKVSRAKLISWLVDMAKGLGIKGENMRSEQDLWERMKQALDNIEERREQI
jgi:hypothetical protein